MSSNESFLGRWSRLKGEARRANTEPSESKGRPDPAEQAGEVETRARAPGTAAPRDAEPEEVTDRKGTEPVDPKTLPPVESLTYEFDYTVFLRDGVPPEIRRQALQRLWRSDPLLANLDGLLEYGEDYSSVGKTKSIIKTAYRVGRGMLHDQVSGESPPQPPSGADEPSRPTEPPEAADVASAERQKSVDSGASETTTGERTDPEAGNTDPSATGKGAAHQAKA